MLEISKSNKNLLIRIFFVFLIYFGFTVNSYATCKKIVSLAPSITETLFYLGLDRNISGITRYAKWPKATKVIRKIGGYYDPNIELIAKINPDIVFLTYHQRQIIPELKQLRINYKLLKFDTIRDMYNSVKAIGKVCNRNNKAVKVIKQAQRNLEAAKAICSKNRKKTALVIIGNLFPVTAAGKKTFMSQMLNSFDMENAYEGKIAWAQISLENIIKLNPDYLFVVSDKKTAKSALSLLKIRAVQDDHIVYLTGGGYLVNSPRIAKLFLETAKTICR